MISQGFQALVLRKLARFEHELVDIKKLLLDTNQIVQLDDGIPKLPIEHNSELDALSTWINEDLENSEKLVCV